MIVTSSVMSHAHSEATPRQRNKPLPWIIVCLALAGLALAIYDHWAHVYGILPYLILLACPLLHVFHGHGSHEHGSKTARDPAGGTGPRS